jgi:hypothetical protein
MDPWALEIYRGVVGIGAEIEALGLLATRSEPTARWRRAAVAAGIGAIALLDFKTWSQNGIVAPAPMTFLWWADCAGLVAALWTLFALGVKGLPSAVRATDGAIAYIACCLSYWLMIVRDDSHWSSVKKTILVDEKIRWIYVGAFVVCLIVLAFARRAATRRKPEPWLPLVFCVWAYAAGYYVLVTFPFLA